MMISHRNILKRTVQPAPWIIAVAILVLLLFAVYIAAFFYQVDSTLSDASWGDISWYNQMAYNFTHGRPMQTSIYLHGGPAVLANPYPYIHSFSLHVNFTPYLFLWPYKLMPTVNGLYLIIILFNAAGFLGLGWLIARQISMPKTRLVSYLLACAVFFCALPFGQVITYKGHFGLFAGPLILAAYYFCLRHNKLMLAVTGLLLCGISEDMAMFVCSFSAYLFIFEKQVRKTALWMGIGSAVYLALVFFVIQPASETGLVLAYATDLAARLNMHSAGVFGRFRGLTAIRLYFICLAAALTVMALYSGFSRDIKWKKLLGLIIVAPASSWFLVTIEGAGHHLMPLLACAFLAFLLMAGKLEFRPVAVARVAAALFICMVLGVYWPIRLFGVKRLLAANGYPFYTDIKSVARMETNKCTLKAVAALPNEAGISYWTNQGIDAFMTSRNSVWRFPDYFDSADYLVIQKDADQTFFYTEAGTSESLEAAIKKGKYYTSGTEIAMPSGTVRRIEHELVDVKASHVVKADTGHVLILQRKEKAYFPSPESTLGLNWIKHIKIFGKTARRS